MNQPIKNRIVETQKKNEREMKNILLVESSPRGAQAYSHQAARSIIDVVRVTGVAVSAIGPEKALAAAMAQSKKIVAQPS